MECPSFLQHWPERAVREQSPGPLSAGFARMPVHPASVVLTSQYFGYHRPLYKGQNFFYAGSTRQVPGLHKTQDGDSGILENSDRTVSCPLHQKRSREIMEEIQRYDIRHCRMDAKNYRAFVKTGH